MINFIGTLISKKIVLWCFCVSGSCWEVLTCGGVPYAGVPAMTLLTELHRCRSTQKIVYWLFFGHISGMLVFFENPLVKIQEKPTRNPCVSLMAAMNARRSSYSSKRQTDTQTHETTTVTLANARRGLMSVSL